MHSEKTTYAWVAEVVRVLGVLAVHFVAILATLFVLLKVVPTHARLFERHDLALPVITRQVIVLSEITVAYWFLILPLAMIWDGIMIGVLKSAGFLRRWVLPCWSHGWILLMVLVLAYVGVGLSLPGDFLRQFSLRAAPDADSPMIEDATTVHSK